MKKKKDLYVEIPEKYKKQIIERFSLKNAIYDKGFGVFSIEIPCPLCEVFGSYGCEDCPLDCLDGLTCVDWLEEIGKQMDCNAFEGANDLYFSDDNIWWPTEDDKEARQQIKAIKKGLYKYVKWV